ncbi:ficolin-2-like [Acanthaster planci]|uniref:Ficolin-2-like n=1 Tax=Acanthaster planci TaxID=133434 RepID=A0A8B8A2N0_ACAPL|nr:ficolin-2-like [Acanthaster planci]
MDQKLLQPADVNMSSTKYFSALLQCTLLLLLALVAPAKLDGGCALNSKYYHVLDHALLGHAFMVKMTDSPLSCAKYCLMSPPCASFNYYRGNRSCELNNATRSMFHCEFVKWYGSVYFGTDKVSNSSSHNSAVSLPTSCKQLMEAGYNQSGIYSIYSDGVGSGLQVYCDQTNHGGGWIVFQRRQDGTVDFYRDWKTYQDGFGSLNGEFWLGNDYLRKLTESSSETWQLQIDLEDFAGQRRTAGYSRFKITGDKYILNIDTFTGDSEDSLTLHKNSPFTTKDNDNDGKTDGNCAQIYEGAWWFKNCHWSHLNGKYYHSGNPILHAHGVRWGSDTSLKKCSMKMREW